MTGHDLPLLQLAIDTRDLPSALTLADRVYPHYDIAEIGTPLIIEEGLRALEVLKARYPDKHYLADLKIMDAGRLEAESAFRRGADIATILAVADDKTIQGALEAAANYGGQLMADLINAPDPVHRAAELAALGVHIVCIHTAHDLAGQEEDLVGNIEAVRKTVDCRLAVAGGLALEDVDQAVESGADILVFGGAIAGHPEPGEAARQIMHQIQEACACSRRRRS